MSSMFALEPKTHLNDPHRKRTFNTRVFTEVAPRYDTITRLLSFGRDRIWKDRLIAMLPPAQAPVCLDLACGTGDLARRLLCRYPGGNVIGIDRTAAMIERARSACAGTCAQLCWATWSLPGNRMHPLISLPVDMLYAMQAACRERLQKSGAFCGRAGMRRFWTFPNPIVVVFSDGNTGY